MQNQTRDLWDELKIQLQREEQNAEFKLLLKCEVAQAWRERWVRHGGQWQDTPDEAEK